MNPPTCITCAHFRKGGWWDPCALTATTKVTFDPVRGENVHNYIGNPCAEEREPDGSCGPDGRNWDPSDTHPAAQEAAQPMGGVTDAMVQESFEKWAWVDGYDLDTLTETGDYVETETVHAWLGWNAALTAQSHAEAKVPEAKVSETDDHPDAALYIKGWNDCRAAMLAAAPEPKP